MVMLRARTLLEYSRKKEENFLLSVLVTGTTDLDICLMSLITEISLYFKINFYLFNVQWTYMYFLT